MTYTVKLSPSAINDLDEAFLWYNEQVTDLGYRFIDFVDKRLAELSITPEAGSIRYKDVRCVQLKIFPYLIHYTINNRSQTVTILRVFHFNRRPLWEDPE
jgi:plasmid stabilization system protein ParE